LNRRHRRRGKNRRKPEVARTAGPENSRSDESRKVGHRRSRKSSTRRKLEAVRTGESKDANFDASRKLVAGEADRTAPDASRRQSGRGSRRMQYPMEAGSWSPRKPKKHHRRKSEAVEPGEPEDAISEGSRKLVRRRRRNSSTRRKSEAVATAETEDAISVHCEMVMMKRQRLRSLAFSFEPVEPSRRHPACTWATRQPALTAFSWLDQPPVSDGWSGY